MAETKHIFLQFENEHEKFHLALADRERTKHVLINLVGNAIKFTKTGGITLSLEEKENHIFVRVKDTGMGISEANKKFLFRKFQQTEENILTHDTNKGTGLGLYISKKFIENMGGTIFLENSEVNKGTSFVFSLPRLEKYLQ
jgi:two-component system, sensor histidine kinase ChiS